MILGVGVRVDRVFVVGWCWSWVWSGGWGCTVIVAENRLGRADVCGCGRSWLGAKDGRGFEVGFGGVGNERGDLIAADRAHKSVFVVDGLSGAGKRAKFIELSG